MPPDWTYFVAEIDATHALLRRARAIWRDYAFVVHDAEPLMVLLATGCEKLLKLTFGLTYADDHGRWPKYATLKSYGHDLARLDADCRALVHQRVDRATHPKVVTALLGDVENDPSISALLTTLTTYAERGRSSTSITWLASRSPTRPRSCGISSWTPRSSPSGCGLAPRP